MTALLQDELENAGFATVKVELQDISADDMTKMLELLVRIIVMWWEGIEGGRGVVKGRCAVGMRVRVGMGVGGWMRVRL